MFGVSKQAYYKVQKRGSSEAESRYLTEEIIIEYCKEVRSVDPNIGGKKLWAMYSQNFPGRLHVGRDRFADILADNHLKLRQKKRKPRTTDSQHNLPTYPNLIKDLIPYRANQIWVSDITYVPIKVTDWESEFTYLALITDAYSHEIVGWKLGSDLSNRTAISALKMALSLCQARGIDVKKEGLIHHSDRGVQYASKEYVELLRASGICISMTENGDPKENAIAERINSTIKSEMLGSRRFETHEQLEQALFEVISFYNECRPHLSNNLLTPAKAAALRGELKKHWRSRREEYLRAR